jgi:hypothetical protein
MSMATMHATISRVSPHGFQVQEEPGRWFNVSKYANPMPAIPPAGTEIDMNLDNSGFVRAITPLGMAADFDGVTPSASAPAPMAPRRYLPPRQIVITRLAALKAAAEFLASRPDAKSTDVLRVAEQWEAWANRAS